MQPKPGQIWCYLDLAHWLVVSKRPSCGYVIYNIKTGARDWSYVMETSGWKLIQDVP